MRNEFYLLYCLNQLSVRAQMTIWWKSQHISGYYPYCISWDFLNSRINIIFVCTICPYLGLGRYNKPYLWGPYGHPDLVASPKGLRHLARMTALGAPSASRQGASSRWDQKPHSISAMCQHRVSLRIAPYKYPTTRQWTGLSIFGKILTH